MKKFIIFIIALIFSTSLICYIVNSNKSDKKINENESTVSTKNSSNKTNLKDELKELEKNVAKNAEKKHNENSNKDNKKKDITIVIDPGHSNKPTNETEPISPDSKEKKLKDTLGSTGVNSKVPEYVITNGVALSLEKILKDDGYNVIMTKRDINTPMSNIERTEIGNKNKANLMIRIHCDGVDSQSAVGASILVPEAKGNVTPKISKESKEYGEKIINKYTSYLGLKNRGVVYRDDLTGFNWSKVPIVLIELGFISNPKEDALLSNEKNYNKIATGIANGINDCFK